MNHTYVVPHHGTGLLTGWESTKVEHDLGVGDFARGGIVGLSFRHGFVDFWMIQVVRLR